MARRGSDRYTYAALSGLLLAVAMALLSVGRHGIFLSLIVAVGILGLVLFVVSLLAKRRHA
jgi:hypothetical protein